MVCLEGNLRLPRGPGQPGRSRSGGRGALACLLPALRAETALYLIANLRPVRRSDQEGFPVSAAFSRMFATRSSPTSAKRKAQDGEAVKNGGPQAFAPRIPLGGPLPEEVRRDGGFAAEASLEAPDELSRDGLEKDLAVPLDEPHGGPGLIPNRRRIRAGTNELTLRGHGGGFGTYTFHIGRHLTPS